MMRKRKEERKIRQKDLRLQSIAKPEWMKRLAQFVRCSLTCFSAKLSPCRRSNRQRGHRGVNTVIRYEVVHVHDQSTQLQASLMQETISSTLETLPNMPPSP